MHPTSHLNGTAPTTKTPPAPPAPTQRAKKKRAPPKKKGALQATAQELRWLWRLLAGVGGAVLLLLSIAGLGWAGKALYEDRAPVSVVEQLRTMESTVNGQGQSLDRIETELSNLRVDLQSLKTLLTPR